MVVAFAWDGNHHKGLGDWCCRMMNYSCAMPKNQHTRASDRGDQYKSLVLPCRILIVLILW